MSLEPVAAIFHVFTLQYKKRTKAVETTFKVHISNIINNELSETQILNSPVSNLNTMLFVAFFSSVETLLNA